MTLIELLMFIAISSIILAMVMISYNVVNNANATKAARRLETVIRTARTQSMAKGQEEGKLTLTVLDGNVYATIGDPATAESQQICNSGVTVTGILCADANDYKNRLFRYLPAVLPVHCHEGDGFLLSCGNFLHPRLDSL